VEQRAGFELMSVVLKLVFSLRHTMFLNLVPGHPPLPCLPDQFLQGLLLMSLRKTDDGENISKLFLVVNLAFTSNFKFLAANILIFS